MRHQYAIHLTITLAQDVVVRTLEKVRVGEPKTCAGMTVFPVFTDEARPQRYITLDEALRAGTFRITEASEDGVIYQVRAENDGDKPVLLVAGEELIGARQNRVIETTVLVPAHTAIHIPVYCVEAGRWKPRSRTFKAAPRTCFASSRARSMREGTASLSSGYGPCSDQSRVWRDVARKSARLGVHSPTAAIGAIYREHRRRLEKYVRSFPVVEEQVGAVVGVNGRVAGAELFDSPTTWQKLWPKIARGWAADAIEMTDAPARPLDAAGAMRFVTALSKLQADRFDAVGAGEDVRLWSRRFTAGGLVDDGRVVHFQGFRLRG